MITGIVKSFNKQKGFGFIQPSDNSADVFVHLTAIQSSGLRSLTKGQEVQFEVETGSNGIQAVQIFVV